MTESKYWSLKPYYSKVTKYFQWKKLIKYIILECHPKITE